MGTKEEYETRKGQRAAKQAEQERARQKQPWWFNQSDPISRLTGGLVVWTALLFIGTGISAFVLWKTDNTLRETLVATERPWIIAETSISGPFVYTDDGASVTLTVHMRNIGHTPALSVMSFATIFFRAPIEGTAVEIIKKSCDQVASQHLAVGYGQGQSLFPNDDITETQTPKMGKKEVESERGQPSFFQPSVVVCARYKYAINDQIRQTAVFYRMSRVNPDESPIAPANLRLFPVGSDAD
jgi:hypothetical protein